MENPNVLDIEPSTFLQIQAILDSPSTMKSFLEVLPPDCSCENVLTFMELESKKYNMTPAKVLLMFLGDKGFTALDLIECFQAIELEKALVLLKKEEPLRIIVHPQRMMRVYEGEELSLTCTAASYPHPEYMWFKDDVELLLHVNPTLTIESVSLKDSGIYTCLVTKWNEKKKAYDWMYSDFSTVEVVSSDLNAIPSLHQVPCHSKPNFILPSKRIQSPKANQDEVMTSLPEKNSVPNSKFIHNGQDIMSPKREVITITKHPYVYGKVAQGMSLCLTCEAVSSSLSVNYQWFKNGRPLENETSSIILLNNLYPDNDTGETKWKFQCEVYNELGRAVSDIAVVELDEVNDTTPLVAQQKYAFLVANDTYDYLEHLQKPAADVKDLATILSSMGFKIFAFRNLTLTEMRNAFSFFCKILQPGSYALFFFAGHGFELYGQTYLQMVDSSDSHIQNESVCSEYILQCMQERKPAMNILLIDACRKLPPNFSENSLSESFILPGKIFQAKMKNNTIYGYSTSFLCASHESDEETNSVFVKHLKKYIAQNKCIQDILIMVQTEFGKDPLIKNVQFPVIKSTLAERRKLSDPVQDSLTPNTQSDILDWCDIRRDIIYKSFEISSIKAAIHIEFHHHMEIFCNGIDAYVYLLVESNADMFILHDMEVNLQFISPVLNTVPMNGIALKDANLLMGRRNFLFKKQVANVQKINTQNLEGNLSLKFRSRNVIKTIQFNADAKIVKLQLSVNYLQSNNVEEYNNCKIIKNSFK